MGELESILSNSSPELASKHPKLMHIGERVRESLSSEGLDWANLYNSLQSLETIPHAEEWYADALSDSILAIYHVRNSELLLASQFTRSAFEQVPDTQSRLTRDAQLMLALNAQSLHALMASPEGLLDATQTAHQIRGELGLSVNRHEAMTNFLFVYSRMRNHGAALSIAELIREEEKPEGTLDGLYEAYLADTLNEVGRYEEALSNAEAALASSDPIVRSRAYDEALIATAGLGNPEEARRLLTDKLSNSTLRVDRERDLHARALIAAAEGDTAGAIALMNQRLDVMVARLYRDNSADAASLLAHLENSRERQLEREAALQREADSAAVIAEQKSQLNRSLIILLTMLGGAFLGTVAFLRYRERVNRERAELQEEALSAEKMKTEFLGLINHELRTPLNGVIGISDALIHHSKDATVRTQAKAIQECGENLFDLIESMIDMTTLEGDKFELAPTDAPLDAPIQAQVDRWRPVAEDKGLAFTAFVAPELSRAVTVDPERFEKCVKILLSNATRFTHEGRIHLHATAQPQDGTLQVKLIVADTGQGMTERVQSRLFKPFLQADSTMTRKYGGAGLSLAIARKLSRMMGGDLDVVSAVDRGSEFTLTLALPLADADGKAEEATPDTPQEAPAEAAPESSEPEELTGEALEEAAFKKVLDLMEIAPETFLPATDAEPDAGSVPSAPSRSTLDGARVLVVEDLPSNQDVIRLMLEPQGCTCVPALDATEAFAILQTSPVDAVVMDIRMAGLDGVEATRRIRAMTSSAGRLPIVVLTADQGPDTCTRAMEAGADAFLAKPVVRRQLVAALQAALARDAAA